MHGPFEQAFGVGAQFAVRIWRVAIWAMDSSESASTNFSGVLCGCCATQILLLNGRSFYMDINAIESGPEILAMNR